jgi:uncharacterized membrane protein
MAVLQLLLGVAYPALIYFALRAMEPRLVAFLVALLVVVRLVLVSPSRLAAYVRALRLPAITIAIVMLITAASNDPLALLMTPTLLSLGLLAVFVRSLTESECIIERFARVQNPVLSEAQVRYCRRVTVVWCGFFLVNGSVALWLAIARSTQEWVVYTGCIAYVLMGLLFASEFVYRQWRFRLYLGAPTDILFQRLFPPRSP